MDPSVTAPTLFSGCFLFFFLLRQFKSKVATLAQARRQPNTLSQIQLTLWLAAVFLRFFSLRGRRNRGRGGGARKARINEGNWGEGNIFSPLPRSPSPSPITPATQASDFSAVAWPVRGCLQVRFLTRSGNTIIIQFAFVVLSVFAKINRIPPNKENFAERVYASRSKLFKERITLSAG